MSSAENSVSEPSNLKIFWGRIPPDPPYKGGAFGTCESALPLQKPSYDPVLMVQTSSTKAKNSHKFGRWKSRFANKNTHCRKCSLNSRNTCPVLNVNFEMLMFFHD